MRKKTSKVVKVMDWLDNGCYPGFIMFSCGFSYDEIVGLLKKKRAKDWLAGIEDQKELIQERHWCAFKGHVLDEKENEWYPLHYIVIPDQFTFSDLDYCKLAHEVLHICQFFLGDRLDRKREYEADAYYHTHIMQQCLRALRG